MCDMPFHYTFSKLWRKGTIFLLNMNVISTKISNFAKENKNRFYISLHATQ